MGGAADGLRSDIAKLGGVCAGKGAAIGAGVGGLFGVMRSREQYAMQQQSWERQQQQTQAMNSQRLETYNRAVNACLSGRGYTVR